MPEDKFGVLFRQFELDFVFGMIYSRELIGRY